VLISDLKPVKIIVGQLGHAWDKQKKTSINTYPCPIFSIFVYFLLGSPIETIVLSLSRISSSDIFFLRCLLSLATRGSTGVVFTFVLFGLWFLFLSKLASPFIGDEVFVSSIGFVYIDFVRSGRIATGGGGISSS